MKPELTAQILGMYVGQVCDVLDTDGNFRYTVLISLDNLEYWTPGVYALRPYLRRLESITNKEANELHKIFYGRCFSGVNPVKDWIMFKFPGESNLMQDAIGKPAAWLYLLSKGFDLFGLIDAGLAKEVSE